MLNALGLGILFQAKDEVSEVAEKIKESLHEVGEKAEHSHGNILKAFGGMGAIAVGAAAAISAVATGVAFEFAEHAEKFSSAIRQAGVAAHATAEQMEDLEHSALTKSMDSLRGSAIETAETLKQLALEGLDTEESLQALNGTTDLLRISMGALDPKGAAALVNDTLGQFGMRADQASDLVDKLAFSMRNFGFRAEELQSTMSGLSAGGRLVNASLDDTLIGVGLIKSVFPSATKAAQAMNVAMLQLADKQHQSAIAHRLGIRVVDSHTKKIRPLVDIMRDLSIKTSKMSEAQLSQTLQTIAGGRAAGGLSAIIDGLRKGIKDSNGNILTGAAALDYYRKQLASSSGTAKQMSDILGDDLGGAIKSLKGGLSTAGVLLGSQFEGGFKHAIQMANLFVRGLSQLFTQGGFSGEVREQLDKHLGIKGFAEGVFMWIKRIQNFFGNLVDTFQSTFAQFEPLLDVLSASFGALGMALGITSQSADENASAFDKFGAAGGSVGSTMAYLAGAIIPMIITAIHILTGAVEVVKMAWEELGPALTNVVGIFTSVFKILAGLFTGNWKMLWDGFVEIVANSAQLVVKILMGTIGWFAKLIDGVGGAMGKNFGLSKEIDELSKQWQTSVTSGTAIFKSVVSAAPATTGTAAIQGQASANAAAAPWKSMVDGGGGEQVMHTHVHVNLDGEKVGETLATARRSTRARSFEPVASGGHD